MLTMMAVPVNVFADDEWTGGSIEIGTGIISNDGNRNDMQYPGGKWMSWGSISWWTGGSGELYDAGGKLVKSFTGKKEYTFENLAAGEYTVKIPWAKDDRYHMFQSVDTSYFYSKPEIKVVITEDAPKAEIRVVAEYKAFDYKTVTDIGTFSEGKGTNEARTEKDYFPDTEKETGKRNWAFEKDGN